MGRKTFIEGCHTGLDQVSLLKNLRKIPGRARNDETPDRLKPLYQRKRHKKESITFKATKNRI